MTYQFDSLFVRRMEAVGMARQVAEELADALGSVVVNGLATRRDVQESASRTDGVIRETELRLRQEMRELELRMTVRAGTMLAGTGTLIVAILGALITLHH